MWRFLFPALAMTAALIVLFAGDSSSWLDLSDGALASIGAEPRHARPQLAPALPVAAFAEQQAARDALQRQVADLQEQTGELQNQIEQRSHDLEQDKAQAKRNATAKAPRRPRAPSPAPPPPPLEGTNNCGTPDEPKPCPPMPRHPLPFYPADRE